MKLLPAKFLLMLSLTSIMLMLLAWTYTGVFSINLLDLNIEPSCQPCSAF